MLPQARAVQTVQPTITRTQGRSAKFRVTVSMKLEVRKTVRVDKEG